MQGGLYPIQADAGSEWNSPLTGSDYDPDDRYFEALREPFGDRGIVLRIGPLRLRLEGLSAPQEVTLARRFRPFVIAPEAVGGREDDLVVSLRQAAVDRFLNLRPGRSETYRMRRRFTGGRMVLWSYEFAGWIETERRLAMLAIVQPEGDLFERGLENFLRVMTARFILDRGGLLVHAAGIVRRGAAYVFLGPSGSGKTTITRLSPRDTILSDDLTLLVRAEGEGYQAAGLPFGMAHHTVPQTSAAYPIVSLNRLVQSSEVGVERVERGQALAELGAHLPFVMQDAQNASRALATAARVLDSIPLQRLRFRRDDSFWSVVEVR
ncbi:MAG TPA: hypothetical protein VFG08_03850 [Candidatus Polarisedimenticolia bacterium]|nr:hypothetical protein [Candidatus Polarisedimenticolia bacterium]